MVKYFGRLKDGLSGEPNGHDQINWDFSRKEKIPSSETRQEEAAVREKRAPATVLVAEDHSAVRKLLAAGLSKEGYEVLTAEDGLQAIQVAERHNGRIDVLVTDVMMPHALGTEVANRLTAKWPHLKVICISGCLYEDFDATEAMASDWVFLQKPFTLAMLRRALRAALGLQQAAEKSQKAAC